MLINVSATLSLSTFTDLAPSELDLCSLPECESLSAHECGLEPALVAHLRQATAYKVSAAPSLFPAPLSSSHLLASARRRENHRTNLVAIYGSTHNCTHAQPATTTTSLCHTPLWLLIPPLIYLIPPTLDIPMSHFSLSFSSSWLATPSEPNTDHPNARDASKPSSRTFGPTNILMLQGYSSLYALPSQSTSSSSSARSSPAFSEDSSSEDESAPESETTAQHAPQAPPPTPAHASFPRASRIRCPTSTLPPRAMPSPRRKTGLALNAVSTSAATATRALPKAATRLAVPLPFSDTLITNRVEFTHAIVGRRGVCLAEWARLAEKRRTHLALARGRRQGDAEVVEDMFAGEERVVFQSYVSDRSLCLCGCSC